MHVEIISGLPVTRNNFRSAASTCQQLHRQRAPNAIAKVVLPFPCWVLSVRAGITLSNLKVPTKLTETELSRSRERP